MACNALPQFYIADTAEVQAAKAQFAAAWNAAAQRNTIAPTPIAAPVVAPVQVAAAPVQVNTAGLFEDGETWPEALPYVHEEIAAEPYVHIEGPSAPAAPVAPVVAPVATAPVAAPITFNAATGGCYNWKGEGVPCRY